MTNKNYMQEVANMLGVELGEKFNIILLHGIEAKFNPYKFTLEGLFDRDNGYQGDYVTPLLRGIYTIEKTPFRPKEYEQYYYVGETGVICAIIWRSTSFDYYRFNARNCFRTEEEAERNKERIVKEMKYEYENWRGC